MRLLLDTHTFLWFVLGDSRCSQKARELIEDEANEKWLSPASHWELAIKISLGKYTLPIPFEEFIQRAATNNGFSVSAHRAEPYGVADHDALSPSRSV